jgi:hypothetical protein
MNILYPAGIKRDPIDRNSVNVASYFQLNATAPHGFTDRVTYTVPLNKRFLLTSFTCGITRESVAAPVATVLIALTYDIGGGDVLFCELPLTSNTVGASIILPSIGGVSFAQAVVLRVKTNDGSTGGTCSYWGNFIGFSFDI